MYSQSKKVREFIDKIIELCKTYNVSLAHEDKHGAFIIEKYFEENIEWLKNAFDQTHDH